MNKFEYNRKRWAKAKRDPYLKNYHIIKTDIFSKKFQNGRKRFITKFHRYHQAKRFILASPYLGARNPLDLICTHCNRHVTQEAFKFVDPRLLKREYGLSCKHCRDRYIIHKNKIFWNKMDHIDFGGYKLIHNNHFSWRARVNSKRFYNRVNKLLPKRFTFITPYIGAHNPIKARCNKCGRVITKQANRFSRESVIQKLGDPCPHCNRQKHQFRYLGEYFVAQYLNKYFKDRKLKFSKPNDKYIHGSRLPTSKDYRKCDHADFILKNVKPTINGHKYYNGTIIEYDGRQHFHDVDFNGRYNKAKKRGSKRGMISAKYFENKKLKNYRIRDYKKDIWCKQHGWHMIRIAYPFKKSRPKAVKKVVKNALDRKLRPLLSKTDFSHVAINTGKSVTDNMDKIQNLLVKASKSLHGVHQNTNNLKRNWNSSKRIVNHKKPHKTLSIDPNFAKRIKRGHLGLSF